MAHSTSAAVLAGCVRRIVVIARSTDDKDLQTMADAIEAALDERRARRLKKLKDRGIG
jgi:hypothetical protein